MNKTARAKKLLMNLESGKKCLLEILRNRYPNNEFNAIYDKTRRHTVLYVDGQDNGYYDVMDKDINSYYALDSLEVIIDMVGYDIKRHQ